MVEAGRYLRGQATKGEGEGNGETHGAEVTWRKKGDEVNSLTPVELGEGDLYTQATFIAIAEVL